MDIIISIQRYNLFEDVEIRIEVGVLQKHELYGLTFQVKNLSSCSFVTKPFARNARSLIPYT